MLSFLKFVSSVLSIEKEGFPATLFVFFFSFQKLDLGVTDAV